MPEQSHPPYEAGSLTIPRQLLKWLDVNPQNGPLTRIATYIALPAFSVSNTWLGHSKIITAYNVESPNMFCFKSFTPPSSPNYALCVSYRMGTAVTRYLLWNATGSQFNYTVTPYTGQFIDNNFRLEVWDTSQGNASQSSQILLYTSKLGSYDYRFAVDSALAGNDGQVTGFTISLPATFTFSFPTTAVSTTN
jgi:hypothetical protein